MKFPTVPKKDVGILGETLIIVIPGFTNLICSSFWKGGSSPCLCGKGGSGSGCCLSPDLEFKTKTEFCQEYSSGALVPAWQAWVRLWVWFLVQKGEKNLPTVTSVCKPNYFQTKAFYELRHHWISILGHYRKECYS